jgi:hypothetical protein
VSILGIIAWLIYFLVLYVAAALVAGFMHETWSFPWWLAYLASINLITFGLFVWDWLIAPLSKLAVIGWILLRVPNWMFFGLLPAIGGFVGTVMGVGVLGHKSSDQYERLRNWAFVIASLAVLAVVLLWRNAGLTADNVNAVVENYVLDVTEATTALASRLAAGGFLRG